MSRAVFERANDRYGRRDTPAVVLHANRVVARSPAAAAEGVTIGQRRRQAQQCCPDAVLLDHDPDRDARAFEPVVRAIGRFAPRLEVVEPGWLCLGARGPSRYFGGDEALAAQLVAAVRETAGPVTTGIAVGIADGRFASAVAARRAGRAPIVVAPGGTPDFLAPLPVAWLHVVGEVDPELVGLFARLGLARLGDLAALPAGDVLARFGPPGRHAHRLAAGLDGRPAGGVEPPPERRIEQAFDDPVTLLEPLVFTAKHLADQLVAGLAAEGRVCTRLVVTAETEHGERTERAWYRAAGLSAPAMVERVRWQLDAWMASSVSRAVRGASLRANEQSPLRAANHRLDSAGVVLLRLAPDEVRGDDGDQVRLWGGPSAADERAARAVARLAGMIGDQGVLVPAWRGGRLPGDRYGWVPASTTDLTDADDTAERLRPRPLDGPVAAGGRGRDGQGDGGGAGRAGPWPGSLPAPSPAVVPPEPQPAELLDAAGRAVTVSGRGELSAPPATLAVAGRPPLAVTGWAGPWPLDERWWDPRQHRRLARLQVSPPTAPPTSSSPSTAPGRWPRPTADQRLRRILVARATKIRTYTQDGAMTDDLVARVLAAVAARDPVDERERASIDEVLATVPRLARPFDMDADPVHVTGSALIVGRRGIVLLRHRRLGIWVQPGGHIDPGEAPWDAALREAREETGLALRHVDDGAGAGPRRRPPRRSGPHPPRPALPAGGRRRRRPGPPPEESQDVGWFSWAEAPAVAEPAMAGILAALATR